MKDVKMEEQTGGELTDLPNEKYQKFFLKFNEIDSLEIAMWKPVHLIGYFCKKFKEAFNSDYKFKFNAPSPVKSFEVFQIKKLSQMLSSKPNILKEYIDWIFKEKVEKDGKKFRSISFITGEDIVKEYKMNVLMSEKPIDRSTLLPLNIINKLKEELKIEVLTFGDLAFQWQALRHFAVNNFTISDGGSDNPIVDQLTRHNIVEILKINGYAEDILEKIK